VLAVVSDAWFFQNPQATYLVPESITIVVSPLESTALTISRKISTFAESGLNVTVRDYEPAITVDGLLRCEVDLVGASEYAAVVKAFKRKISA
jgi:hypothetical protein